MGIGVYPGSFDPVTWGHVDIIRRAARISDMLIVGVLTNRSKQPMFTLKERIGFIEETVKDLPNVRVQAFEGLAVDFVRETGADFIVRGLRTVTDFEGEIQMSQINRKLYAKADTVFLPGSAEFSHISSSMVKEIASFGGDVSDFVPPCVEEKLHEVISKQ